MSLRQVLTIYNAERLLSADETALLNTLRRMSDGDRQMFIDGLAGKSSSQKKSSKKSAGGGGGRSSLSKSPRASGMAAQLNKSLQGQRRATTDDDDDSDLCQYSFENGGTCKRLADHNIHHLQTDSLYHPFVSTAQPAESSSNQATSETGKGGAGDAHHAASSGG